MADLPELLVCWGWRPEATVTDRYPLTQADEAYRRADAGRSGKVCLVLD